MTAIFSYDIVLEAIYVTCCRQYGYPIQRARNKAFFVVASNLSFSIFFSVFILFCDCYLSAQTIYHQYVTHKNVQNVKKRVPPRAKKRPWFFDVAFFVRMGWKMGKGLSNYANNGRVGADTPAAVRRRTDRRRAPGMFIGTRRGDCERNVATWKKLELSELTAVEFNPNRMSQSAMKKLMASIKVGTKAVHKWNPQLGFRLATSITVNRNGLRVVGGAHRVEALLRLGQSWIHEDDITWIDVPAGGAREKAINVELNRKDAQGEFDQDQLRIILSDVQAEAPEEYLVLDLDELAEDLSADNGKDADLAPEVPDKPASEQGAAYTLGDHVLLCGDCTDRECVRQVAPDGTVDLVFTDPPYNMDYRSKALGGIRNDALGEAAFVRLILASMGNVAAALRDGGAFYVCMSGAEYATVANQLRRVGMAHRLIVWVKNHTGLGAQEYRPQFELILYGVRGAKKNSTWRAGRRERDVWEFDPDSGVTAMEMDGGMMLEFGRGVDTTRVLLETKVNGRVISFDGEEQDLWRFSRERGGYVHPTQKPVAIVERALGNSSSAGDIVFDPFGGSGTTLVAAERMDRKARVIELDPKYCDVIRRRWAEYVHGPECDWQEATPRI